MNIDNRAAAILGAIVADAASLGLHWLYDPVRIAEIAKPRGSAAFVPINAAHFADTMGYFAHAARRDGACSQYGDSLRLALTSLNDGRFDVTAYQSQYAAHFGPGGTYVGYIDRPTRGTLNNLANEFTDPSGVDDDQLPAITRLPVVVAYGAPTDVIPAIQVTNVNDVATAAGGVFANLLRDVIDGTPLPQALRAAADGHADLQAALSTSEKSSVAYGEVTKQACHLPMALPLSFHILAHAENFADAVERNIRAGGDSCGRAIIIGSVMAAAHGAGDIPLDWTLQTLDAAEVLNLCQAQSN